MFDFWKQRQWLGLENCIVLCQSTYQQWRLEAIAVVMSQGLLSKGGRKMSKNKVLVQLEDILQ